MVIHMVKTVRFWCALILLVILAGCMIMKYSRKPVQRSASEPIQSDSTVSVTDTTGTVSITDTTNETMSSTSDTTVQETDLSDYAQAAQTESVKPDASVPFITDHQVNAIIQKLHTASLCSDDLIGWIYVADSDIDYPIVQGTDNQYYLHHAPDGSENRRGSIFLSYQCPADFSGALNILYGHNMQYSMFGDIRKFKDRDQFDKHRYGWLFTTENLYRIDFFTLSIVSAYDTIYDIPADRSAWMNTLTENSMYYTETDLNNDDAVVTLSTCATDFEDARALFAGKLTWIQEINIH